MQIREASNDDAPFLWVMLTYAASMHPGGLESVEAARTDAYVSSYVEGWKREGDFGLVAVSEEGAPLGAAWLRLLEGEPHPHKVSTREIPELAIGVDPGHRGHGVGAHLLSELIVRASAAYPAIVLSVRETNASVRLYERAGFVVDRRIVNRVGGDSLVMRRSLWMLEAW